MILKNAQHINTKNVLKMFLFVFLLCCVLQPLLHYYCVFGKRESLQRFVVEDGAKPAIFGSYSYDPVRQVFVPPPPDTKAVNDTFHHPTESHTIPDTQTHTEEIPLDQHTSTPSDTSPGQVQSGSDLFLSTLGDTGTDSPEASDQILRKHVEPLNNIPWWERPQTSFKNLTFNFI